VFAAVKASTKDAGGVAPDYPLTAPLGPQLTERFPGHLNLCQLDPLCKGGVHDPGVGIGGLPGAKSEGRLRWLATIGTGIMPQYERLFAIPTGVALIGLGYSLWRQQRTPAARPVPSPVSSQLEPAGAQ